MNTTRISTTVNLQGKKKISVFLLLIMFCMIFPVYAQNREISVSSPSSANVRISEYPLDHQIQLGKAARRPYVQTEARLLPADTCAGVYSPGNPYPCCSYNDTGGFGNCTFAGWYHAKRFWGVSLPTWGGNGASDAKNWFDNLKNINGYPTSPTPALYSLAVSSTYSTRGHVGWVMEIRNNEVLLFEQLCESGNQGITQTWHPISRFNKGFVLSPVSAPSPTLTLATPGPVSRSATSINFNQTNVNPGMRVVVIFPNGTGRATLKDAQLSLNGGTLTTYVTLGTSGTYQFQVFNENGKYSGMTNVVVN